MISKRILAGTATLVALLLLAAVAAYTSGLDRASPVSEPTLAANGVLTANAGPFSHSSYDLASHQTLSRVILLIRENYVEPERIKPFDMFIAALDYIQRSVPEVLVEDDQAPERIVVRVGSVSRQFELGNLDQLWEVTMALRDIFRFMQSNLSRVTDQRDIEYAAINGLLSTLDPHSVLLRPESFDEVKLSTKGEFGGLGIVISIRDGALTIISPISGTPASRAGLRARDKIVKIGEESTVNMGLEEAVSRLRGRPGTSVDIWVLRKGWNESRRFSLTRAKIKIESVTSEPLANDIGYIRIKNFQGNTYDDLATHLDKLRTTFGRQLKGLVLDMRNNPGGLLDQAILISDRFIDHGALVITVGEGNRKRDVKPAHFAGTETDYPIVVLVNGGSASASEIVAGALKNQDRAVVVGQQTFGKGSVQVLYDFKDRSALKLTIAQYLTPGDVSIQSVGITPDIELIPATVEKDSIHLFVRDDTPREKDLDKHLDQHGNQRRGGSSDVVQIVHVVETPKEGEEGAEFDEDPDRFEMDFEIALARDLLVSAAGTHRPDILENSREKLSGRMDREQSNIAKSLEALGIDWSDGKAGAASIEVSLKVNDGTGGAVGAGDTMKLTGTVTNTGAAPVHRVYGTTHSDNPFLNNLEFVFGKIDPGESQSWPVEVKIPRALNARADKVSLAVGRPYEGPDKQDSVLVVINEQKKPRFEYSILLDDRANGNGDGMLQVGEKVGLRLNIRNRGDGDAIDVVASAKNQVGSTIFLEVGRVKVGAMKVGASALGELRFEVKEPNEEAEVKIRLSLWDSELGNMVSDVLTFPIMSDRRVRKEARSVRVKGTDEVPVYAGAHADAPVLGYVGGGAVLRTDASFDGAWRRVRIKKGVRGFLRFEDSVVIKGKGRISRQATRELPGQSAPAISLDLSSLEVATESLRLTGTVEDQNPLKDIYIFVNDRKVHYQSLDATPEKGGLYRSRVNVDLPLKPGSNAVSVVVRENDDLVSRRIFGVYRHAGETVAKNGNRDSVKVH